MKFALFLSCLLLFSCGGELMISSVNKGKISMDPKPGILKRKSYHVELFADNYEEVIFPRDFKESGEKEFKNVEFRSYYGLGDVILGWIPFLNMRSIEAFYVEE